MANTAASRFTALKARIKAEMTRRNGTGSVTTYGDTTYDYSTTPAKGGLIRQEHADKNLTPLRAVNASGLPTSMTIVKETDLAVMETRVVAPELTSRANVGSSDCASSCTGMCVTACTTTCSGCTGSCTGTCSSCSGTCSGSCSSCSGCSGCSSCSGSCTGSCTGCTSCSGCSGGCGATCAPGCGVSCGGINTPKQLFWNRIGMVKDGLL